MNLLKKYMLLLLSTVSLPSYAVSPLAEKVMATMNIPLSACKEELIVEKQLPYATGSTVLVIPRVAEEFGDDGFSLDYHVLVVDNKSGQILQRYFESHKTNGLASDAVRLDHISIDTAPYKVKQGMRAFGIRVSYEGSSRANPYDYETLTLFLPEGKALKNILKNFTVKQYTGEWDTNCAGVFRSESSTLDIATAQTNGFFDLIIKNKIMTSKNVLKRGDCIEQRQNSQVEKTLKFRQGKYQ